MNMNTHTLLCWHAERAGIDVLKNTLKKLSKKATIKTVLYLVQSDSKAGKDLPEEMEGAEIKKVPVQMNDPTNHQAIYQLVRDQVVPMVSGCESHLHINVSPGTPAMHSVWLMLFAGGAFPIGTTLWSSQYNPNTKRTSLNKINFPITTYMAEVRSTKKINPDLGIYEPEAKSAARQQVLKLLKQYSELSGHPLLILGGRGTGKTRMVETYVSKIKQQDVVALACGGLNSTVAESLLFGHVKGAFTGADENRKGLLGEADGKLLLLDEVQDLPRNAQRQLVRTLQDKDHKYRQIGSDRELTSNFELVCASNLTFDQLRNVLYPDFFDRIAHLIVEIPPLRLCREDLRTDWQQVWRECRKSERIPEKAPICAPLTELFDTHNFSGNLRDLQRLAVLIMVWIGEESEQEAVKTAIDEWSRWERNDSTDVAFGCGSWQERTTSFQEKLALWSIQHFGSAKKAAEMLDCSERTIANYQKNKAK